MTNCFKRLQLAWKYADGNPITQLQWVRFHGQIDKYFLVVTTNSRFYQYIGGPSFAELFAAYGDSTTHFETTKSENRCELKFYSDNRRGKVSDTPEV